MSNEDLLEHSKRALKEIRETPMNLEHLLRSISVLDEVADRWRAWGDLNQTTAPEERAAVMAYNADYLEVLRMVDDYARSRQAGEAAMKALLGEENARQTAEWGRKSKHGTDHVIYRATGTFNISEARTDPLLRLALNYCALRRERVKGYDVLLVRSPRRLHDIARQPGKLRGRTKHSDNITVGLAIEDPEPGVREILESLWQAEEGMYTDLTVALDAARRLY